MKKRNIKRIIKKSMNNGLIEFNLNYSVLGLDSNLGNPNLVLPPAYSVEPSSHASYNDRIIYKVDEIQGVRYGLKLFRDEGELDEVLDVLTANLYGNTYYLRSFVIGGYVDAIVTKDSMHLYPLMKVMVQRRVLEESLRSSNNEFTIDEDICYEDYGRSILADLNSLNSISTMSNIEYNKDELTLNIKSDPGYEDLLLTKVKNLMVRYKCTMS